MFNGSQEAYHVDVQEKPGQKLGSNAFVCLPSRVFGKPRHDTSSFIRASSQYLDKDAPSSNSKHGQRPRSRQKVMLQSALSQAPLLLMPCTDHFLAKTNTVMAEVNPIVLLVLPRLDQIHTALPVRRQEETHTSTRTALHPETVAARRRRSVVAHAALLPSAQEMEVILTEDELAHHHLEGVVS
jgi:hypothetical protein